ncbi:hypothetical protein Zmor_010249 [Zophobas morio]|uniref:Uncharacterized protein n=1 Tax=Zophobas morio TaxID=2755281 RepID=A0AA38IS93_9CUCU|nr:hypothetical protein Zmor_010249 [Zophobas morio]
MKYCLGECVDEIIWKDYHHKFAPTEIFTKSSTPFPWFSPPPPQQLPCNEKGFKNHCRDFPETYIQTELKAPFLSEVISEQFMSKKQDDASTTPVNKTLSNFFALLHLMFDNAVCLCKGPI